MANLEVPIKIHTRDCLVDGRPGYFHCWEQYSRPVAASPLIGGEPAGVIAQVFGIVEFADGVERVQPYKIKFVDEESGALADYEEFLNEKGDYQ